MCIFYFPYFDPKRRCGILNTGEKYKNDQNIVRKRIFERADIHIFKRFHCRSEESTSFKQVFFFLLVFRTEANSERYWGGGREAWRSKKIFF